MKAHELVEMKLHETAKFMSDDFQIEVLRVMGGWIYFTEYRLPVFIPEPIGRIQPMAEPSKPKGIVTK